MFERFTDRARRVIVLAQEEARGLNHNFIGTEHLLLGLIHEGEGVAPMALESLGVPLEAVRARVEEVIGRGERAPGEQIPFTPRAKKVLELSLREALALSHNYIGTEHILLGLVREGEGIAAQVLTELGVHHDELREQVVRLLSGRAGIGPAERPGRRYARLSEQAVTAVVAGGPGRYSEEEGPPELVRVLPLAREVDAGPGLRIVLISLEVWSGWIDLRYAMLPVATPAAEPEVLLAWRVADDAGTTYEHTGMVTGGGPRLRVTQLGFRPAPPPEARTLTLTVTSGTEATEPLAEVEVDLADGA
jgi:Clp amino terminal domain, pathogenicity island component